MSIQYKLFAFSIRSLFTMVWCSPLPSRPFCHLHSPTYIIALQHSTNLYLLACITCASSFLWNFCTRSLSFSLIFRKSSPPPPSPLRCFSAFVFRVEKVFSYSCFRQIHHSQLLQRSFVCRFGSKSGYIHIQKPFSVKIINEINFK